MSRNGWHSLSILMLIMTVVYIALGMMVWWLK